MFLSDKDIIQKLSELEITTDCPVGDFDAKQIQPWSIDLRLSNVFWIPRKKTIDLRKSVMLEMKPRQLWKKIELKPHEHITLNPGQLILGRICEEFTMPKDCGGMIIGRGSFARLGLSVHCNGNLINPGYRGRMPLQLYNCNPNPIKIFPFIPICQLVLHRFAHKPQRLYGREDLYSKYMNDDGGPSLWWRDARIDELQKTFQAVNLPHVIRNDINERISTEDPEIIERFERFIHAIKNHENAASILESFIESEKKLQTHNKIVRGLSNSLFPLSASAVLASIFVLPITYTHYCLFISALASLWPFIWSLMDPPQNYYVANKRGASN